jgi:large subunit ribosomal protein L2
MFYKTPGTNSKRHGLHFKKFLLTNDKPLSKLLKQGKKLLKGRSSQTGHITSWHRGGGAKVAHRLINPNIDINIVLCVTYSPLQSSFLALCYNFTKEKYAYTLAVDQLTPGSLITSYSILPELNLGTQVLLKDAPIGSIICKLGGLTKHTYIKSAGVGGILLTKTEKNVTLRLPSGTIKNLSSSLFCTLGSISNPHFNKRRLGKAGVSRLMGRRPVVRGVAMNPVDHPHGGQTSGGTISKTPWGIPTKGKKTVKVQN